MYKIPYFHNVKFLRVSSLVGRYKIVTIYSKKSLKLCFPTRAASKWGGAMIKFSKLSNCLLY